MLQPNSHRQHTTLPSQLYTIQALKLCTRFHQLNTLPLTRPQPALSRSVTLVTRAGRDSDTAIQRVDDFQPSTLSVVQQTVASPFTALPIALGSVGAYLAGYGPDGAILGRPVGLTDLGRHSHQSNIRMTF